jgi:hypothetical protein
VPPASGCAGCAAFAPKTLPNVALHPAIRVAGRPCGLLQGLSAADESHAARACGIAGVGTVVKDDSSINLWLLIATVFVALIFYIGMLMPGGIGPP